MISPFELLDSRWVFKYADLHPDILIGFIIRDIQEWALIILQRRFGRVPKKIVTEIHDAGPTRSIEMVCRAYTCPNLKSYLDLVNTPILKSRHADTSAPA